GVLRAFLRHLRFPGVEQRPQLARDALAELETCEVFPFADVALEVEDHVDFAEARVLDDELPVAFANGARFAAGPPEQRALRLRRPARHDRQEIDAVELEIARDAGPGGREYRGREIHRDA